MPAPPSAWVRCRTRSRSRSRPSCGWYRNVRSDPSPQSLDDLAIVAQSPHGATHYDEPRGDRRALLKDARASTGSQYLATDIIAPPPHAFSVIVFPSRKRIHFWTGCTPRRHGIMKEPTDRLRGADGPRLGPEQTALPRRTS